jgi:hypothetical protein
MKFIVTVYNIAQKANVSPSTVSRVLNSKPGIKAIYIRAAALMHYTNMSGKVRTISLYLFLNVMRQPEFYNRFDYNVFEL